MGGSIADFESFPASSGGGEIEGLKGKSCSRYMGKSLSKEGPFELRGLDLRIKKNNLRRV